MGAVALTVEKSSCCLLVDRFYLVFLMVFMGSFGWVWGFRMGIPDDLSDKLVPAQVFTVIVLMLWFAFGKKLLKLIYKVTIIKLVR